MRDTSPPSERFEAIERQRGTLIAVFRAAFIIILSVVTGLAILRDSVTEDGGLGFYSYWWIIVLSVAAFSAGVIALDILTPRRKLTTLSAIVMGVFAGLLVTLLLSWVIDLFVETYQIVGDDPEGNRLILAAKVILGIGLCYLGITTVLQTQDDFRLVIPYVEFSKQYRGQRPLVLDTSALIDGRILDVASTGVIQSKVLIPRFVIGEMQRLADSEDRLKRARGRRGLELLARLQRSPHIEVVLEETPELTTSVDQGVIDFAREVSATILTTDTGLAHAAAVHSVPVLNLNDLANALKPNLMAGETVRVRLLKAGEQPGQGVGYLEDGTMVVAEGGGSMLDQEVELVVTGTVQTSAGRLVFARPRNAQGVDGDPGAKPIDAVPESESPEVSPPPPGSSVPTESAPATFRSSTNSGESRRSERNPRRS